MEGVIHDGEHPLLEPRAYQLEMLQDSVKRNIIVAVGVGVSLFLHWLTGPRWIREVGKLMCIASGSLLPVCWMPNLTTGQSCGYPPSLNAAIRER